MTATLVEGARKRWRINPKNILADFIAAFTVGVASIPDSMASALLAGINPLAGLYTMIIATPIGALFTSSEMMHISTTSALSLAVASSLATGMTPADKLQAVYVLALMVGVIQISLGLLKMGFLVRFVPHSVMTGFLNGVAILIILGQLRDFTGYASPHSNRVVQAVDTALNAQQIVLPVLVVGLTMVLLILILDRIKLTSQFSFILAMIFASLLPFLPWFQNVPLVGDVTQVPSALPSFSLPDFSLMFKLIVPAFALSVIGLVQGAGISQGYPNPDGKFADPSGDFFGQGAANLAASFFKGMPCGGSLSGTAMVVNAGARSRWANFLAGVLIAITVLLFARLVELIAMPALAGLLIVIGFRTLNFDGIRTVWQTGMIPRVVMGITFVGTLVMPLQFAVLLGVGLSILLFTFHQANRLELVELVPSKNNPLPVERPAPKKLSNHHVTVLYPYGSLFYAAAKTFEENLPAAEDAKEAVVIFVLRGYDNFGSTMITVLDRYNQSLQANGGKVMLAGISPGVFVQLERTGLLERIGRENVFLVHRQWGVSAYEAYEAAQAWLDEVRPPAQQEEQAERE
ncbi:MAG: SulP family inorganic anion transporter [Bacteroidota bacterium]